jgi:hypothetical protein
MKKYMQPELKLTIFEVADVITTSGADHSYGDISNAFGAGKTDVWGWN